MNIISDQNIADKEVVTKCSYAYCYDLEGENFTKIGYLTALEAEHTTRYDAQLARTTGNYTYTDQFGKRNKLTLEAKIAQVEEYAGTQFIVSEQSRKQYGISKGDFKKYYKNDEHLIYILREDDNNFENARSVAEHYGYIFIQINDNEYKILRDAAVPPEKRTVYYYNHIVVPERTFWLREVAVTHDIPLDYKQGLIDAYNEQFGTASNKLAATVKKNWLWLVGAYLTLKGGV